VKVKLLRDLYEHRNGKVIKHLAGTEPDLPKHVAEYVNYATIEERKRIRSIAERFSFTPEAKKK